MAVAFGNFLVIDVIESYGLGQGKQMLLPPIALQRPCNGRLVVFTPIVPELGQRLSMALASQDGADDRQPGDASDVADHMLQLDVHLRQRFLHMLDMLGGMGKQHRALPQITAEDADLISRPEGASEQPEGVEALNPLAVMHVTFGPALDLLDLLRIDQEDLEATRLEQLKERDPID